MEAQLVKFSGNNIVIRRADGRSFEVSPSIFSEADQTYVEEFKKTLDPSGKPWNRNSYRSLLLGRKWIDGPQNSPNKYYYDFELEKIDLDGDKRPDGQKVTKKKPTGIYAGAKPMAWDVDDDGVLSIKYINIYKKIAVNTYGFDKEQKVFKARSVSGTVLRPHKRQLERN